MLKTLRLSDNRLTSLPEEMGQLLKLEAVFLAGNQLVTLPHSMAKVVNSCIKLNTKLGTFQQFQSASPHS